MNEATLIVYLDGFGYRALNEKSAPFLFELAGKNSLCRLKTLLAFTGIEYTIFTGKYPDAHGVWLEFGYSPETSPFKWLKFFSHLEIKPVREILSRLSVVSQLLSGRTFIRTLNGIPFDILQYFDTATRDHLWKFEGAFFKQLAEKRINFFYLINPFTVKNNKVSIDLFNRDDKYKCNKLIKNIDERIKYYYVHLVDIDKTAHSHGADSKELQMKIRQTDASIERVVKKLEEAYDQLNVVILSDHAMENVEHRVNVQKKLEPLGKNGKDYLAFYDSTMARFWFDDEKKKELAISLLEGIKGGHILSEEERQRYHIPQNRKFGELIFLLDSGCIIHPNFYQGAKDIKAMHGYSPEIPHSEGLLITSMETNKKELDMIDILPILKSTLE